MLDFIVEYWLEALLGAIAAGLGFVCKYFYGLYKKEKAAKEAEQWQKLENLINESDQHNQCRLNELNQQINSFNAKQDSEINIIKTGVLDIQKENFMRMGAKLLDPNHIITFEEYEIFCRKHEVYKSLGGNHEGDLRFENVTVKYQNGLKNE